MSKYVSHPPDPKVFTVACPYCKAGVGEKCFSYNGRRMCPAKPHDARRRLVGAQFENRN